MSRTLGLRNDEIRDASVEASRIGIRR